MNSFPQYTEYNPDVPVWCITPDKPGAIHRFFDTSPLSPSGRLVALTRFPFEDRVPNYMDPAEVILIDLETGIEKIVAETKGWGTQLGAQPQWGADDTQLFYNDCDQQSWQPYAVMYNAVSGESRRLDGPVYMASRDGRYLASPCLKRLAITQAGYGIMVPEAVLPYNCGAPDDDGLYITDTASGACRMIVSVKNVYEAIQPQLDSNEYSGGGWYMFHVKWNVQGTRLMLVLRWRSHKGNAMKPHLVTLNPDGTDIQLALPYEEWGKGGHHPDWCPDGDRILMNLKLDSETLRFITVNYDGTQLRSLNDDMLGSGHPSLHPDGSHILTDAYVNEPVTAGDGTTPIRLVNVTTGEDNHIIRINRLPEFTGKLGELRIDPHPVWDRSYTRIVFNGCHDGRRRVYLADLSSAM